MDKRFSRTETLLGEGSTEILASCKVALFGVGGVGGYVAEALARSAVGSITLFDKDVVDISNINRQIIALESTVGMSKCEAMRNRILDINPNCRVECNNVFYLPENADEFPLDGYDYIIDAVDTVSAKLEIIVRAKRAEIPVISAMGAGNKTDPTRFEVADIYKTSVCPLARVMRRELKSRGIDSLKVVYSREDPVLQFGQDTEKRVPASAAFVPSVAGLIIAREVVFDLLKAKSSKR